jgi:hypothetical protein
VSRNISIKSGKVAARWGSLGVHARSEALHLRTSAAVVAMQVSRPIRPKTMVGLNENAGRARC